MSEITIQEIHKMSKEQAYMQGYKDGKTDNSDYSKGFTDGYETAKDECQIEDHILNLYHGMSETMQKAIYEIMTVTQKGNVENAIHN